MGVFCVFDWFIITKHHKHYIICMAFKLGSGGRQEPSCLFIFLTCSSDKKNGHLMDDW